MNSRSIPSFAFAYSPRIRFLGKRSLPKPSPASAAPAPAPSNPFASGTFPNSPKFLRSIVYKHTFVNWARLPFDAKEIEAINSGGVLQFDWQKVKPLPLK